jgi:hypothetical protein
VSKGQQAMAMAMMYPESRQGKKDAALPNLVGKFTAERLRQARAVLRHSRSLAERVPKGSEPLVP